MHCLLCTYFICQGEGVVRLHSNSQDFLVAIDDGMGNRCKSGVANLQTHACDVPHTLGEFKIHVWHLQANV